MDRLIVLGTGNAQSIRFYNTCFALENDAGLILCDAGGGNGIMRQLRDAGIGWERVHDLIVTHAHSDHLTGVLWVIRRVAEFMNAGKYQGQLRIYCHESIRDGMTALCRLSLQKKMHEHIGRDILFLPVTDGAEYEMAGRKVRFFDILSTKMLQYGFTASLSGGRRLCCLGDEPYNPGCADQVKGASWVLCEAFCLYGEREKFKPYEKHHSTVKEACELAQSLSVPNLVVWHTEDSHEDRKALYTAEGRAFYTGSLFVPDDLEVLSLE